MKKKQDINQVDLDAFHRAVKGTRRISHDKVRLSKTEKATSLPSLFRKGKCLKKEFEFKEQDSLASVGSEAKLSYQQPGISHKILRNLRKGQYNVEAVLDLHGMTVNEAKAAMNKFLRQCIADGLRIVLIIHGKGRSQQPILKNKLNHWLRGLTEILAFCSASSAHGSRGAVYVYLKKMES